MSQLPAYGGSEKLVIPKSQLSVEFFDQLVVETAAVCSFTQQQQWKSSDGRSEYFQLDTSAQEACQSTPKRPMNAFMVWAQMIRRDLHRKFSNVQNALLSKSLGRVWRSLDSSQKEPFVERANWIKTVHKHNYPNYRYQPRRVHKIEPPQATVTPPPNLYYNTGYHYNTAPSTNYWPTGGPEQEVWPTPQVNWQMPQQTTTTQYINY